MQQRAAADVLVEERHGGAQFGQGQPGENEIGPVPHEESRGVPGPVPGERTERVGRPVADPVRVRVRVRLVFENQEGSVRVGFDPLQETIQDEEEGSPPSPRRVPQDHPEQVPAVEKVHPEERTQRPQGHRGEEHGCDKK